MPSSVADFDRGLRLGDRLGLRALRRATVGETTGRVLEVGCGTGLNLAHYSSRASVVGIEPDEARLALAATRVVESPAAVELFAGSAEALPFLPHSFDAAVATLVFCSIPTPERALAELRRVLVPGGAVRLLEHVRVARPLVGAFQDAVAPLWYRLADGCHPNRDTLGSIRDAGLVVDHVDTYLGGLLLAIQARTPTSG